VNRLRPEAARATRHLPGTSFALSLLAILGFFAPGAGAALEYDRAALAAGQLWRLLSCHWTHWSAEHLVWDLLAFALLATACERLDRRRFLAGVLLSALLIPLATWCLMPHLASYRGLSGIDSALFALLSVALLREVSATSIRAAAAGALLALAAKIAYELLTGSTVFVHTDGTAVVAVPLAHVIGAMVGAAVGAWGSGDVLYPAGGGLRGPDRPSRAVRSEAEVGVEGFGRGGAGGGGGLVHDAAGCHDVDVAGHRQSEAHVLLCRTRPS
jgi:rhomboid family GlyGly-CTERM serine protease